MQELREAAMAYYRNGPANLQQQANSFFDAMDTNSDDRISHTEFVQFLEQAGYDRIYRNLFNDLAHSRRSGLDFEAVLTLYYVLKTRQVFCRNCRVLLKGLYFTCVTCFDSTGDTYDLCLTCYGERRFDHLHLDRPNCFLDSYVMLRSRRGPSRVASNSNMSYQPVNPQPVIYYQPLVVAQPYPVRPRWWQAFQGLEMGVSLWNIASVAGCTIM